MLKGVKEKQANQLSLIITGAQPSEIERYESNGDVEFKSVDAETLVEEQGFDEEL